MFAPSCQPTGRLEVCFQVVFEFSELEFVRSKLPADWEIESHGVFKLSSNSVTSKFVRFKTPVNGKVN